MNSYCLMPLEKFPKRRAFIVINKFHSKFIELVYWVINLCNMTHQDEWAVAESQHYKTSH